MSCHLIPEIHYLFEKFSHGNAPLLLQEVNPGLLFIDVAQQEFFEIHHFFGVKYLSPVDLSDLIPGLVGQGEDEEENKNRNKGERSKGFSHFDLRHRGKINP